MHFLEKIPAKNVLMCPPTYFSIDYQINPWMVGHIDRKLAQQQWEKLYHLYQKIGLKVKLLPPVSGLPDLVFTTDQGIIWGQQVFVSHFKYSQRSPESVYFRQFIKSEKYKPSPFPSSIKFEGGDCLWHGDQLFVGYGFRTSKKFIVHLRKSRHLEIISLKLINSYFYHLDTCLFILNPSTACCYPKAFSPGSLQKIKKLFSQLYFFSDSEAFNFSANSVKFDNQIIVQKNNPNFKKYLTDLSYYVHEIDVSEFSKSGGGIRCLTLKLTS